MNQQESQCLEYNHLKQSIVIIQDQEQYEPTYLVDQQPEDKHNKPKRPLSSYFFFVKHHKQDFPHENHQLAELGRMWKNLPPDYKDVGEYYQYIKKYNRMQEDDKKRYDREIQEYLLNQPEGRDDDQIQKEEGIQNHFPIHRIKYILKFDEDGGMYSKDAYFSIQRATEVFAQTLLNACKQHANEGKRKRLQEEDLYQIIKERDELEFLECLIPIQHKQPQNQIQKNHEQQIQKQPKVQKKRQQTDEVNSKQNNLLDFFQKL